MTLNLQPWAVAAAILLIDNDRQHYKELTKKVQATSLSSRGGETPWETLRSRMGERKKMFYGGSGDGYYELCCDFRSLLVFEEVNQAVGFLITPLMEEYCQLIRTRRKHQSTESQHGDAEEKECLKRLSELHQLVCRVCDLDDKEP